MITRNHTQSHNHTITQSHTHTHTHTITHTITHTHTAGLGAQALYSVSVLFTPSGSSPLTTSRRIGFRTFALVTGNDTDAGYVNRSAGADGTDTQGMLFRVNGAAILSRGANMIPMEELEVSG